jgi:hypothetical protein
MELAFAGRALSKPDAEIQSPCLLAGATIPRTAPVKFFKRLMFPEALRRGQPRFAGKECPKSANSFVYFIGFMLRLCP